MELPVKQFQTRAEQAFVDLFNAAEQCLPGAGNPWVADLRAKAIDAYEALGLPHGDDAPLLIDADGNRIPSAQVPLHLRRARLQRVGIEANGEYCKGLLAVRYPAAAR